MERKEEGKAKKERVTYRESENKDKNYGQKKNKNRSMERMSD
jgi:hypothetical protein